MVKGVRKGKTLQPKGRKARRGPRTFFKKRSGTTKRRLVKGFVELLHRLPPLLGTRTHGAYRLEDKRNFNERNRLVGVCSELLKFLLGVV